MAFNPILAFPREVCTHIGKKMLPRQSLGWPASWKTLVVSWCGRGQNFRSMTELDEQSRTGAGHCAFSSAPPTYSYNQGWNLINVGLAESIVSHGKSSEMSGVRGKQCCGYGSVEANCCDSVCDVLTVENVENATEGGFIYVITHVGWSDTWGEHFYILDEDCSHRLFACENDTDCKMKIYWRMPFVETRWCVFSSQTCSCC